MYQAKNRATPEVMQELVNEYRRRVSMGDVPSKDQHDTMAEQAASVGIELDGGGAQPPAVQPKLVPGTVVVPPPAGAVGGKAAPKARVDMSKYVW